MKEKIILFLFLNFSIFAQSSVNNSSKAPSILWKILPGGTYFYEGNYTKGTLFAVSELSLLASSIIYNEKLKKNNESEYYNYPFLAFGQLYTIEKGDYLLKSLKMKFDKTDFKYEIPTFNEMLKAPFDFEEISKPFVLSFIAAGVLDAIISYSIAPSNKRIGSINKVFGYGSEFNPTLGSSTYLATSGLISYGAGVSEEMLMRGWLLPQLDYKFGRGVGLTASSLIFSALHIPSYLNIKDTGHLLYAIVQITAGGFVFGLNAQLNNYNIKSVIAAHAWFNFMVMTTSWILNPKENPLGFSVSFKL